jgi:hypothetical protein
VICEFFLSLLIDGHCYNAHKLVNFRYSSENGKQVDSVDFLPGEHHGQGKYRTSILIFYVSFLFLKI